MPPAVKFFYDDVVHIDQYCQVCFAALKSVPNSLMSTQAALAALEAVQPKFPCKLGFVEWS
jgi:hypothetical protein